MKNKTIKPDGKQNAAPVNPTPRKTILLFLAKGTILLAITAALILYSDSKGYFNADDTNNHTQKKWDSFYKFTEKNNVDILLVGNSHLYTGINPKNLSEALGVNAFILASPGTSIADSYFCLEEALTKCKPQIIVVETYGINYFVIDSLPKSSASDQIKSFSARKNIFLKLKSTPLLFNPETWLYAWSGTIRNHNFIFTDQEQIKKNRQPLPLQQDKKLYLGRYVRWTSGLEDSTLLKYKNLGAPVDGQTYKISGDASLYVEKIATLCKENNIELVFLTLPMYHEHIKNYAHWKSVLNRLLAKQSGKWLDLQEPYDHNLLRTECFENSYSENQHITYHGSLVCSYKLAEYIQTNCPTLKRQDNTPQWHNLFYGDEGYFENYPPYDGDPDNIIIAKDLKFDSLKIKEINLLKRDNYLLMLVKTENTPNLMKINVLAKLKQNNQQFLANIEIPYDVAHMTLNHRLFSFTLKSDVEILEILKITAA